MSELAERFETHDPGEKQVAAVYSSVRGGAPGCWATSVPHCETSQVAAVVQQQLTVRSPTNPAGVTSPYPSVKNVVPLK